MEVSCLFRIHSIQTLISRIYVKRLKFPGREHVFRDLRPYICLLEDCASPDQDFERRNDWSSHMFQEHWWEWACPFGCNNNFFSASGLRQHLGSVHAANVSTRSIDSIISHSIKPDLVQCQGICPLCNEVDIGSCRQYQSHVGHHLEQLALSVLPASNEEAGGETGEEKSKSAHTTEEKNELSMEDGATSLGSDLTRLGQEKTTAHAFSPVGIGPPETAVSGGRGEQKTIEGLSLNSGDYGTHKKAFDAAARSEDAVAKEGLGRLEMHNPDTEERDLNKLGHSWNDFKKSSAILLGLAQYNEAKQKEKEKLKTKWLVLWKDAQTKQKNEEEDISREDEETRVAYVALAKELAWREREQESLEPHDVPQDHLRSPRDAPAELPRSSSSHSVDDILLGTRAQDQPAPGDANAGAEPRMNEHIGSNPASATTSAEPVLDRIMPFTKTDARKVTPTPPLQPERTKPTPDHMGMASLRRAPREQAREAAWLRRWEV